MNTCTECGHELGIGRFCTNCGHPVAGHRDAYSAWRTDTAERPRVVDVVAPPPPPPSPPTEVDDAQEPPRHRGPQPGSWLPWAVGFLALLVVAGLGAWLLFGDDGPPQVAAEADRSADAERRPRSEPSSPETSEPASEPETPAAAPGDLARFADVTAPPPAPASQDTSGDVVRYVATNMVDGSPTTCWRMRGDGTGESITFRFEGPVRLSEVGLVNGYAKRTTDSAGVLDWYAGNRRIRAVEWTFDDGTVLTQRLDDTTEMQTVGLDDVETETATVRLLEVTPPGPGRASRDYTAISDVLLFGASRT